MNLNNDNSICFYYVEGVDYAWIWIVVLIRLKIELIIRSWIYGVVKWIGNARRRVKWSNVNDTIYAKKLEILISI